MESQDVPAPPPPLHPPYTPFPTAPNPAPEQSPRTKLTLGPGLRRGTYLMQDDVRSQRAWLAGGARYPQDAASSEAGDVSG